MTFSNIKQKNKGFTLIELLAVIVILAIIALIAIPVIQDIVKHAKKEVLRDTAYGLVEAGQNKCSSSTLKGTWNEMLVQFENNVETSEAKLSDYFDGKNPDAGQVNINDNCKTAIAIWNDKIKTCAYKGYSDDKVALIDMKNSNTCKLETSGDLDDDYVDTSSTGYKCSNPGSIVSTDEKYFTFDQATGTITAYSTEGPKDVIIPCKIGGVEVKTIGRAAFYGKQLVSVIMPDTVKTINQIAFAENQITKLELGSSVENINNGAFCHNNITNLVLPDSLKRIESSRTYGMSRCDDTTYTLGAFHGNNLTNVTFGSGLEFLGDNTFAGWSSRVNSIASVDMSRATKLSYIGAYSFSTNQLTDIDFSNNTELVTIGDGAFATNKLLTLNLLKNSKLSTIGVSAFSNNKITDLSIGGTNLTIGNSSFNQNTITSVVIDGSNVQIGTGVFANNLIEDISLKGVTSIGSDAFKNNQLPDSKAFVMNVDASGNPTSSLNSYGGANRNNIVIPDSVTNISSASFTSLGLTGSLNTGNGLTAIEDGKFYGNSLTNVVIGNSIKTIGKIAFSENLITNLNLGTSVEIINNGAFCHNNLTNLVLPDSLKRIESSRTYGMSRCNDSTYTLGAFHGNKLTSVTLGSGLEFLGDNTFAGWSSRVNSIASLDMTKATKLSYIGAYSFYTNQLLDVDFTKNTELLTIGDGAFATNKLVSLNLLQNTKLGSIGASAFSNNKIMDLSIGGTNLTIGNSSFSQNTITALTVNGTNIQIGTGVFANNLIENLSLTGVTSIGADAFKNNQLPDSQAFVMNVDASGNPTSSLNSYGGANRNNIVFPDSVTNISNATFTGLGLTGSLNTGNGLTTINDGKFYGNALTSVVIGNSITTIGKIAFSENLITNLNLGTSVQVIDNGAFCHNNLTNLVLPDSLKRIESSRTYGMSRCNDSYYTLGAFHGNNLTSVTLGSGLEFLGDNTFAGWSSRVNSIANLDMSKATKLSYIGAYSFYTNQLTNVDFTNNLEITTIGDGAFATNKLASLNLLQNTKLGTIGGSAFSNNKITNLSVGGTNLTIGNSSFSQNTITALTINGTNIQIGTGVFANNLIENLSLTGVTSIGADAFKNNQLPNSQAFIMNVDASGNPTSSLNSYAGANRNNIAIPDSVTSISSATFSGLGFTGSLSTGNGLTTIEDGKFYGNALTSVVIGNSVKTIGKIAFSENLISNLNLGNSVEIINNGAFCHNNLTNLILPDSLKRIESSRTYGMSRCNDSTYTLGAFHGNNLTSVTLGSGIEFLGDNTFAGWSGRVNSIANLDMSRSTKLSYIGEYSLASNNLTDVEIPSSVTSIGTSAFTSNPNLGRIFVKGKVNSTNFTSLGTTWNGTCSNIVYELNSCYTYSGNTITGYFSSCSKDVAIPASLGGNTITTISDNAFKDIPLTSLTIPTTINNIGSNAFSGTGVNYISVLGRASDSAFTTLGSNWNGGSHVIYQNDQTTCLKTTGTTVNGYYTSANICDKSIIIPSSVTDIASNSFNDTLYNSITVRTGTRINSFGTNWNGTIYKVTFEGDSYDYNCFTLSGNTITGYKRFCKGNVDLSSNTVQGVNITAIGDNAFKNSAVTGITLGSNITNVGVSAFEGNNIENISLVDGLVNIGNRAFYNIGLTTLSVPGSVMTIGDNAFDGNSRLATILVNGKTSSAGFISLGTSWNGTCNNIIYNG